MKKNIFLALLTMFSLWGCGEAGIQSDISKSVAIDPINVSISVPAQAVGLLVPQTPPVSVNTGAIQISGEEFEDYLSDAERFTINEMTYSIENFPAGSEADLEISIQISVAGGAPINFLSTTVTDAQNNVTDVVLYPAGSVNAAAVSALEGALLNGQSFEMDIELVGRDVTLQTQDIDFDLVFKFDLTARIQLD